MSDRDWAFASDVENKLPAIPTAIIPTEPKRSIRVVKILRNIRLAIVSAKMSNKASNNNQGPSETSGDTS